MEYDDIAIIKIEELQKQVDLLTLGLLQAKNYIAAIQKEYNNALMETNQFHYPEAICRNTPPECFNGCNACLSCPMAQTCRLLYKQDATNVEGTKGESNGR